MPIINPYLMYKFNIYTLISTTIEEHFICQVKKG